MIVRWLKQTLPQSLLGRSALILLAPMVLLQIVVSVIFIQRHFEGATEQMSLNLLPGLVHLLEGVAEAPELAAAQAVAAARATPLAVRVELPADTAAIPAADRHTLFDLSGRVMIATFRGGLDGVLAIDLDRTLYRVHLWHDTPHGPIEIDIHRDQLSTINPHQLPVLMLGSGALMTLIAFLFLSYQIRPIRDLAEAADAFGKGQSVPFQPRGAREVEAAGRAFLDMRDRIERQIEQRTLLLSGVSHDLRTPITRLRLGLSMLEQGEEIEALEADLGGMERLLDTFLDFSRDSARDETSMEDPVALVRQVVENAHRAEQDVRLVQAEGAGGQMRLRPYMLARAVENLISNAVRYGTWAEVRVVLDDQRLCIVVEDDGPGIPPERREEAKRPFTRLDLARNQDRGPGAGLGLAIVLDAMRSHGGTLELGESTALGGLRAVLVVPR